ncbi:DUF2790 domain-containing protein [Pseudomonas sp. Fl5BN2]|uniref:DUF2790 domain-containing protein n=1 Tax=unclassified Pseudomonas TaxID=196821 RepID=UPI001378EF29|nr:MULTISPECIES: DUF2790 domain-containing protein [unclassified Pseudomonas]NBF02017.1 DUF2790 domain-containing protein [Pseudomonas sp. Fl5BN2]NBF08044.1 DUF2790 domain-containing protein [Pseudomonas sp. Fl4BN1]
MNLRIGLTAVLLLSAASGLAQADSTTAVPYHYGMPVHVAKVISMSEPETQDCKVITADMKYIDNAGKPEEITYRKLSDACSNQN